MGASKKFEVQAYIDEIESSPSKEWLILGYEYDFEKAEGYITYNPKAVNIDPEAPDFTGSTTLLNDEEFVRAVILLKLADEYGYALDAKRIDIEKVYQAPGRPKKDLKGSRADLIVRDNSGEAFLYFEIKTPEKFITERSSLIEGQLFVSSIFEPSRPKYLVWATLEASSLAKPRMKCLLISTEEYPEYRSWHEAGEPSGNAIPKDYGKTTRKRYAKVDEDTDELLCLDESSDSVFFSRLVSDLHDVVWGGGGTSSNEVFAIITKLLLCKIYDENETRKGKEYEFQIQYSSGEEEAADDLVGRMNELYRKAETGYLAVSTTENAAFDKARIKPAKVAYVVRRLEGISLLNNVYDGDLLGVFFEEIVAHGFTQTRGQFFTPTKLVDFMLDLCMATEQAKDLLTNSPDGLGIRRFPNTIDPSCGVGSFLISYMKRIIEDLGSSEFQETLNNRELEAVQTGLAGSRHTHWARFSLFGIENNYDLGLAAKVNMILHGDGCMNTFVASGLLPFSKYRIERRPTVLETTQSGDSQMNGQFDLVLSNPPFSIKLTDNDKAEINGAFSGELDLSEELFIERWYQLLRPGGRFCCVLPESICDTKTECKTRVWMLSRFHIKAVVSLPYSAFQPYTSVKTCVVYAEKRPNEVRDKILEAIASSGNATSPTTMRRAFEAAGVIDEPIFMAEPLEIGYKRRKGLPDLVRPNDLPEVLRRFLEGFDEDDSRNGFFVTLSDVLSRNTYRLDPKYRWLWDKQHGEVDITGVGLYSPLSDFIELVDLVTVKKGGLDSETMLVDLDAVDGRTGAIDEDRVQMTDSIGSNKVLFEGADLLFSKLEPYLGKVVISPPQGAIGTTEWKGLKVKTPYGQKEVAYALMLPQLLESYRRLQSGKRHARLDIKEILELKINADPARADSKAITTLSTEIEDLERKKLELREEIDGIFRNAIPPY